MKTKKVSEKKSVKKVNEVFKENNVTKTQKTNEKDKTLSPDLLQKMNAYWRAANYLSVGQIYLYDNPLLKEPLKLSHVKPLVVGHWGTTPGQNFIYVHLNRVIKSMTWTCFT
jgi:xylulose-5-phosphate/fructose-6-phosphate phosphoketolase